MKQNIFNQQQNLKMQKKFLLAFKKKKPDKFGEFINKLRNCISKKMNSEMLYSELKEFIVDDEELILLFNPFVCKPRKITVKLTNQFSEFSKLIIKKIPKEYTKTFVNQMKTQLVSPSKVFHSISEMIDYLHSSIKKNKVIVQKFPEIEQEILKLKQEYPLVDQPYVSYGKKPKLKKIKNDKFRGHQISQNQENVQKEMMNEKNFKKHKQINYHEDIEYIQEENDIQNAENNEKLLLIAFFRRLKTNDFVTFLKLFGLYTYSVISYVEFILLAEKILIKVEKRLCKVLRNILESREQSRIFINPFAIKQNSRHIKNQTILENYKGLNSSYKYIIHNLKLMKRNEEHFPLTNKISEISNEMKDNDKESKIKNYIKPEDGPLVNKEFYCLQYGNESGGINSFNYNINENNLDTKNISSSTVKNNQSNKNENVKVIPEIKKKENLEVESKIKLPYFMNSHNKNEDNIWNVIKTKNLSLEGDSIYSALANTNANCIPKINDKIKIPKKNGSYVNIRKLLLKTEDEKHEIDVKLLQFLKTEKLLEELEQIYIKINGEKVEEEKEEQEEKEELQQEEEPENQNIEEEEEEDKIGTQNRIIIEESKSDDELEQNVLSKSFLNLKNNSEFDNQKKALILYDKYFKKQNENQISKNEKEELILKRLDSLKILNLIYESHKKKKIQIIDIIRETQNPLMVARIRQRVLQKIKILEKVKLNLARENWKPNMINNFYKILDVRSSGLQQNEKTFITPKFFISSLIETEKKIIQNEKERIWEKQLSNEIFMPIIHESIEGEDLSENDNNYISPSKRKEEKNQNSQRNIPKSMRKLSTAKKAIQNKEEQESEENLMYNSFVKINKSFTSTQQNQDNAEENIEKIEEEKNEPDIEIQSKKIDKKSDLKIEEEENLNQSCMMNNPESMHKPEIYLQRNLPYTNSLMKLLGINTQNHSFNIPIKYQLQRSRYVNPIKIFSMKDISVIQDSIFFAKLFVFFSKSVQDKESQNKKLDMVLTNFFVSQKENEVNNKNDFDHLNLQEKNNGDSISDLITQTRKFELILKKEEEFKLSEKMSFEKFSYNMNKNKEKLKKFLLNLKKENKYSGVLGLFDLDQAEKEEIKVEENENENQDNNQLEFNRPNNSSKTENKNNINSIDEEKVKECEDPEIKSEKEDDEQSCSKWSQSQKKNPSFSSKKLSKKIEDSESVNFNNDSNSSVSSKDQNKNKLKNQFNDLINKSQSENNNSFEEIFQETKIKVDEQIYQTFDKSFFGYYNFNNFYNFFVLIYERLKMMKHLSKNSFCYNFLKQIIVLNISNIIDTEVYEDIVSCLLQNFSGIYMNFEKILSNLVKEIPNQEIDKYVISLNSSLFNNEEESNQNLNEEDLEEFNTYPKNLNHENTLLTRTCHKLSCLTLKTKSNNKQSQIQSYINNNNLINDHILKFEFRSKEKIFVIHKIKSIYEQNLKQSISEKSIVKFINKYNNQFNTKAHLDLKKVCKAPVSIQNCQLNKESQNGQDKRMTDSINFNKLETDLNKKVFIRNEIEYDFDFKYKEFEISKSRQEDKLFAFRQNQNEDTTKNKKRKMLLKAVQFRNILKTKLEKIKN